MSERTDHNEALRLADELDAEVVRTVSLDVTHTKAAALLRQQAEQIDQLRAEVELYREFFDADQLVSKIMDEVSPGLTSPKGPEWSDRADAAIARRCAAVAAIDQARTTHKDEG